MYNFGVALGEDDSFVADGGGSRVLRNNQESSLLKRSSTILCKLKRKCAYGNNAILAAALSFEIEG
jgi:hypothetical protein